MKLFKLSSGIVMVLLISILSGLIAKAQSEPAPFYFVTNERDTTFCMSLDYGTNTKGFLDRLTFIKTNGEEVIEGFGIIDSYKIVIDDLKKKRMVELEVTLSEWLYNSVIGQEVLSINNDYFRLRKPIDRRIYEIARKHCGKQKQWHIGLENLHKKVGSTGSLKKFREAINHIIKHDHLPDYSARIEGKNVIVNFKNYKDTPVISQQQKNRPFIKSDTIEKAKRVLGRSFDVYTVESEWLQWWEQSGKSELQSPDGAFFNFCKARMEKEPEL